MRIYTDECVGCPPELGCIGSSCPYYSVERFLCDECGLETKLYIDDDGRELCESCLLKKFPVVEGTEWY